MTNIMQKQEKENQMVHSRVLRFRAWDKKLKKMIFPETIKVAYFQSYPKNTILELRNDLISIMQFTGLLDKSGKEIYEGDIVKAFHPTELVDITVAGEVCWNPGEKKHYMFAAWYLKPKDKHTVLMSGDVEYEIIGNIYENKELLTK